MSGSTSTGEPAIVLSGGGATGAFEIGVLKVLLTSGAPSTGGKPLSCRILTGTSVGSYNAAYLTSRPDDQPGAIRDLQDIWLKRVASTNENEGNGVFRIRGNMFRFLHPEVIEHRPSLPLQRFLQDSGYLALDWLGRSMHLTISQDPAARKLLEMVDLSTFISTDPLQKLLVDTLRTEDVLNSKMVLRIATTCWDSGDLVTFGHGKGAGNDRFEPLTRKNLHLAVLASAAMPGLFPQVHINGRTFADGGVVMDTPLRSAIRAGGDVLHVIFLNPKAENLASPQIPHTSDTFYRLYIHMVAVNTRRDIAMIRAINRDLDLLHGLADFLGSDGSSDMQSRIENLRQRYEKALQRYFIKGMRKVSVHVYRPSMSLEGLVGFLDFRHSRVEELIELGIEEATTHDCERAGCILAS